MKPYLAIFLYCLTLALAWPADTSAPPPQRGNRFLFVLETTTSMTRASKSAQSVLLEIIQSGALGQMHVGDTFGIWTYNSTLSAGRFPMHQWAPDINFSLGKEVSDFLLNLKFEREGDWNKVWAPLTGLIKSSRALTIVLVTDGLTPLQGTPFDEEINGLYRQNARELRAAKMPFVTALVVRNGDIVDYAVNSTLGPLQIPNPPMPQPEPRQPAAPPASTAPPVTSHVATPVKPPPITPVPAPVVITNNTKTAPAIASIPSSNPPSLTITNRTENPAPTRPPEKTEMSPPPVPVEKSPVVVSAPATDIATNKIPAAVSEPVTKVTAPEPIPAPKVDRVPAPPRNLPAQSAVAIPPETTSKRGMLIASILALSTTAVIVLIFLTGRRRAAAPSLISRSMDPGSEPPAKK